MIRKGSHLTYFGITSRFLKCIPLMSSCKTSLGLLRLFTSVKNMWFPSMAAFFCGSSFYTCFPTRNKWRDSCKRASLFLLPHKATLHFWELFALFQKNKSEPHTKYITRAVVYNFTYYDTINLEILIQKQRIVSKDCTQKRANPKEGQ